MTEIFILVMIIAFMIYDVVILIKKGSRFTLTYVLRKWYRLLPILPFGFALVFIGHVGLSGHYPILFMPRVVSNLLAIIFVSIYSIWIIINRVKIVNGKPVGKFYLINCRFFFIPMIIGSLIGWLWR